MTVRMMTILNPHLANEGKEQEGKMNRNRKAINTFFERCD